MIFFIQKSLFRTMNQLFCRSDYFLNVSPEFKTKSIDLFNKSAPNVYKYFLVNVCDYCDRMNNPYNKIELCQKCNKRAKCVEKNCE